jgi:general secretion pathway protein C
MVGGADHPAPALPNSTDELTDYIRIAPVYQGHAIHALEVYSTQSSNVFTTLGLEPGDRLTSIDGEAVTDSSAAIASLRRLTQGAAMQVTVERGGRPQTISLNGLILTAARSAATE